MVLLLIAEPHLVDVARHVINMNVPAVDLLAQDPSVGIIDGPDHPQYTSDTEDVVYSEVIQVIHR